MYDVYLYARRPPCVYYPSDNFRSSTTLWSPILIDCALVRIKTRIRPNSIIKGKRFLRRRACMCNRNNCGCLKFKLISARNCSFGFCVVESLVAPQMPHRDERKQINSTHTECEKKGKIEKRPNTSTICTKTNNPMATESFSHCRSRLGVCVRMMLSAAFVGGRRCVEKHIG